MCSKLKTLIKFIIYYFINLSIKPSKEIKPKSLLLIRIDAIGDYVMFRNFIKELTYSKKYRDYSITLLGNRIWESLAEELDSKYVDRFIWLDRDKFNKDFLYRYKKLHEITSNGYETVMSPVFSREFFYADTIVKCLNAKTKIGSIGDLSNIQKWQKNISDRYYDILVPAKDGIVFEFDRNKEFFENVLHVKLNIKKPYIELKSKEWQLTLPHKYAILFIGSSARFRKWNVEGFAKVGMWLKEKYGYEIVLCGSQSDSKDAAEFAKYFDEYYVDMVGKTSLVDLLSVISNGNLMVTNETLAAHLAVALEIKNLFVISNGNHYGRFTPYPKEVSRNYHGIYHPNIVKDLDDYKKLSNIFGFKSDLDINEISLEDVVKTIEKEMLQ